MKAPIALAVFFSAVLCGTVQAQVMMTVSKADDLKFGSVVGIGSGSFTAEVPVSSNTIMTPLFHSAPSGAGEAPQRARFVVNGQPDAGIKVTLTPVGADPVTYSVSAPNVLDGGGLAEIFVGAVWTVSQGDSGFLSATFSLTVEYDPVLFP